MTAFEAKTRFGELLHRVERGEEIVITRHDRPVARVVREGAPNLDSVSAFGKRIGVSDALDRPWLYFSFSPRS
jgi:antitoxin (DNA-binding transcriptional repressor) of toxin-antitoxin stability system